jgi:hypothetical protein
VAAFTSLQGERTKQLQINAAQFTKFKCPSSLTHSLCACIMKAVLVLCLALFAAVAQAFVAAPASVVSKFHLQNRLSNAASLTSARVSKTALSMAADAPTYWEGEWVCADCGYIYDRDDCGGLYFEQQVCAHIVVTFSILYAQCNYKLDHDCKATHTSFDRLVQLVCGSQQPQILCF